MYGCPYIVAAAMVPGKSYVEWAIHCKRSTCVRFLGPIRGWRTHSALCLRPTNTGNISVTASYP
jgi:hypothetical protein